MFSDAEDYRSDISISEEQEIRRKYEYLQKHGRIKDIHRIEELEQTLEEVEVAKNKEISRLNSLVAQLHRANVDGILSTI